MKIAIIEDNMTDMNILQTLLEDVVKEMRISAELFYFETGKDFLNSNKKEIYDLIFLDILMPETSGTQLAALLRKQNIKSTIIFVSVTTEYVMESYDVDAFYYLVKPLNREKIYSVMSKLVKNRHQPSITVREKRMNVEIPVKSIVYACSQKHFVEIYLEQKIIKTYMNFSDLMNILSSYEIFRMCNRGILINLEYIKEIDSSDRTVILYSGARLPISKKQLKPLQQEYLKCLFTKVRNGGEII